jgi:ribonuclease VapC
MVADSSALVALVRNEAGFEKISKCLAEAPRLLVSAVTILETQLVLTRWPQLAERFASILRLSGAQVVPADEAICQQAFATFLKFGKGRNPAALNICDCISYATAAMHREPLLFVGDDFVKAGLRRLLEG